MRHTIVTGVMYLALFFGTGAVIRLLANDLDIYVVIGISALVATLICAFMPWPSTPAQDSEHLPR